MDLDQFRYTVVRDKMGPKVDQLLAPQPRLMQADKPPTIVRLTKAAFRPPVDMTRPQRMGVSETKFCLQRLPPKIQKGPDGARILVVESRQVVFVMGEDETSRALSAFFKMAS